MECSFPKGWALTNQKFVGHMRPMRQTIPRTRAKTIPAMRSHKDTPAAESANQSTASYHYAQISKHHSAPAFVLSSSDTRVKNFRPSPLCFFGISIAPWPSGSHPASKSNATLKHALAKIPTPVLSRPFASLGKATQVSKEHTPASLACKASSLCPVATLQPFARKESASSRIFARNSALSFIIARYVGNPDKFALSRKTPQPKSKSHAIAEIALALNTNPLSLPKFYAGLCCK
ncbi:MAG: hypothetical protein JWM16_4561 [Verrucomicrobiales bacterium]|nr:hypothetical protein [Verrucomicrobiales bacterium]